jgi:L-aspartate oxidase
VFSRRAAVDISNKFLGGINPIVPRSGFELSSGLELPSGIRSEVREIVQSSYFVNPDAAQARRGLSRICEIEHMIENGGFADGLNLLEVTSLVKIAKLILTEVTK